MILPLGLIGFGCALLGLAARLYHIIGHHEDWVEPAARDPLASQASQD